MFREITDRLTDRATYRGALLNKQTYLLHRGRFYKERNKTILFFFGNIFLPIFKGETKLYSLLIGQIFLFHNEQMFFDFVNPKSYNGRRIPTPSPPRPLSSLE